MAKPSIKTIEGVARNYGLHPSRVEPLSSVYKSAAAYLVTTRSKDVVVKPYLRSQLELSQLAGRIRRLNDADYPHVEAWLPSPSGRLFTMSSGNLYYATRYVQGEQLSLQHNGLYGLGQALARLHTFSWAQVVSPNSAMNRIKQHIEHQTRAFATQLPTLISAKEPWSRWFRQCGANCNWLASKALDIIHQPAPSRQLQETIAHPCWIHGDATRPNVLVPTKGPVVLIDWESMRPGFPYQELAKALNNTTDFQTSALQTILSGYSSIQPLTRPERSLVCAFSLLPLEVWSFAKSVKRVRGDKNTPSTTLQHTFSIVQSTFDARMTAARYLCNWSGETYNR